MTTQKYRTNLNCGSCVAAVKPHLDSDPAIRRWSVDTADPEKVLTVEGEGVTQEQVEHHVARAGFEVLGRIEDAAPTVATAPAAESTSFLATYRPLLLVLAYLIGVVAVVEFTAGRFEWMQAMANFMGGFFVGFSFFKLLNLRGFVDAYQTYDVVARPVRAYGYAYPFIELALGVAYLTRFAPVVTNLATLAVMLVSVVGVTQALLQRRRIRCACLGTVFNLPMTKVTFVEDALMAEPEHGEGPHDRRDRLRRRRRQAPDAGGRVRPAHGQAGGPPRPPAGVGRSQVADQPATPRVIVDLILNAASDTGEGPCTPHGRRSPTSCRARRRPANTSAG